MVSIREFYLKDGKRVHTAKGTYYLVWDLGLHSLIVSILTIWTNYLGIAFLVKRIFFFFLNFQF